MLKHVALFYILVTLWVNLCQGKRLIRFLPGSGCGITQEITTHVVYSPASSMAIPPCSRITEDITEFKTKFKGIPPSAGAPSIPPDTVEEIHGEWSVWSEWSTCSEVTSTKERTRTCTNPPPSSSSLDCTGDALESTQCQQQSSAPSYYDNDQGYDGNSISDQSAMDARRCHILCQNSNEECVAWTWKTNGLCSHYAEPGQLIFELGSTSGLGILSCLQDKSRYVGDNLNISREIDLAEDCQDICSGDTNCLFFTHDTRGRICHLKAGHTGVETVDFFVSGPKEC